MDAAETIALAAAVACVALAWRSPPSWPALPERPRRLALASLAFAAALLSYGYLVHYLRGAPKIIDATAYWLQARALSHGRVAWEVPGHLGGFAGRFLLARDDRHLGGIFPQGYPLALAAGFALGAPWVVGCALAAALVAATASLAAEFDPDPERRPHASLVAAVLSVICATLRFHTAETMSHGAAALALTAALAFALRASRGAAYGAALSGLALGWLASVRPVSTLAVGAACAWVVARSLGVRGIAVWALGALPGVGFHVVTQRLVTGRWWEATQSVYYAVADGPRGCFRYGFGEGVGCRVEHGAFVDANLPRGYWLAEAVAVTLRRLRAHAVDVANAEPLLLAFAWAAPVVRGHAPARLALAVVGGHVVAYAPFYFDGNVAGGGARMLADVLPVEHALLGVALARRGPRASAAFVALALAGFALRSAPGHRALRSLPDHGARALAREGVARGLVLVEGDHAFNLLHDPSGGAPVVARLRGDAHDDALHERLGRPATWRLGRDGTLDRWRPSPPGPWRFRGRGLWPPRAQEGGYAVPRNDGALDVVPTADVARVRFEVPAPGAGRWCARAHFVGGRATDHCEPAPGGVRLAVEARGVVTLREVELVAAP